MSHRRWVLTGICISAVTAGMLIATTADESAKRQPDSGMHTVHRSPDPGPAPGPRPGDREKRDTKQGKKKAKVGVGAFLGSGPEGVRRIEGLEKWLDGRELNVGHTYLPGDHWANIEGRPEFLRPWVDWRKERKDRMFVLNVPMLERNEAGVPDYAVDRLLQAGASGAFDRHFRVLAERLVGLGVPDTILVLGWEMNGTTYTHRCAPNPGAWKAYWRRIVTTMRSVPGADFRFDFTPTRGEDAIGWTSCYPGDDVVDIIGMDSYDQPPGDSFKDHVTQPFGLRHHAEFAAAHGMPVSFPEWGLFREGDNPQYMRAMLEWIRKQKPVYHTITDYCPHGVWRCDGNPRSSAVFRTLMTGRVRPPAQEPVPIPVPTPKPPAREHAPWRIDQVGFCLDLGGWIEKHLGHSPVCYRYDGKWTQR